MTRQSYSPPNTGAALLLSLVLGTAGLGCAGGAGQIDRAATTIIDAVPVIEKVGMRAYERELTACADDACAERVKVEWQPFVAVMVEIRGVWCQVAPEAEGCAK